MEAAIKKFIDSKDSSYIILHLASYNCLVKKILSAKYRQSETTFQFDFNSIYWFFLDMFNLKENYCSFEGFCEALSEHLSENDLNAIHSFTNFKIKKRSEEEEKTIVFLGHEFKLYDDNEHGIFNWTMSNTKVEENSNIKHKFDEHLEKLEYTTKFDILNQMSIMKDHDELADYWLEQTLDVADDFVNKLSLKKYFKKDAIYKWDWFVTVMEQIVEKWMLLALPKNSSKLIQYYNEKNKLYK